MLRAFNIRKASQRSSVWLRKKKLLLYRKYLAYANIGLIVSICRRFLVCRALARFAVHGAQLLGFVLQAAGAIIVIQYEANFIWPIVLVGLGCQGFGVLGLVGTHGKGGHATNAREGGHRTSLFIV